MQAYDILMLVVLGLAVVWGAWKGLVWQIASILSISLSYLVALKFRAPLAGIINASPPWNIFVSMLILFLGTGLIVWIGFNLISEMVERVKLKEFDRQLGGLFGAAKGALLCVLITLFSVALLGDTQRQAICSSRSGYYIAMFLDRADLVIPRELHDVLAPYLDRLDRSIPHPHAEHSSPLPTAWNELQNGLKPTNQPQAGGWQRELETIFSGQQTGGSSTFPTADFVPRSEAAVSPHTAGRIQAQPSKPAEGSFPRW